MLNHLQDLGIEIRQAVRCLWRAPAHAVSIILLLALGIGANAAMFSLFSSLFVRQLPVHEPEHLAVIFPYWSVPDFLDFRSAATSFSGMFAAGSLTGTVVSTEAGEQVLNARGGIVTGNYFQVLGVAAARGRVFTEMDDDPSHPQPVMVISDGFWRRQFASDPQVLGRRMLLSGSPFTVAGVMPPAFTGDQPGQVRDFWVPLNLQPIASPQGDLRRNRGYTWLSAMGRLKTGVSMEQAQAEARVIVEGRTPGSGVRTRPESRRVRVESGSRGFGGVRRSLGTQIQVLAGIVGIILLIVCANVATLLLARGADRQREIAVRQALGSSRFRLMRQLFTEGLILAGAAGAIALMLAPVCARGLLWLQPNFDSIRPDLALDGRMLAFGAGISILTAILFSIAPLLRASRIGIEPALKSGSRGSSGSAPVRRAIRGLVVVQTALSVVLVTASFLFAQSLAKLRAVDAGYDRQHIVSATVDARFAGYRDDAAAARLGQRLVERLRVLPGVESASVGLCAVLMGCSRMAVLEMEGREVDAKPDAVWINPVSSNYFETAGIPIVEGRGLGAQDRAGSVRVAVVTQALARYFFPSGGAIGKRFAQRSSSGVVSEPAEIVGVVRDVKFVNPRDRPIRLVFLPVEQSPAPFSYVQVRTAGPPGALVASVRSAILEVDPKLYVRGPDTLATMLDMILSQEVLLSRAGRLFGSITLVLACFGTYGVVSYLVAARRTELGIRAAIGAQPGDLRRHVIGDAVRTVLPGLVLGSAAAWAGGRFVESLLFGVTREDPTTYTGVGVALLLVTVLAAFLPAQRASRIAPVEALRSE